MNYIDAFVISVDSEPYEMYGKWWVDVTYKSWGVEGKSKLFFDAKEKALEVDVDFQFMT